MSKSLYIDFRDNGFWAYDVPSSVFLKYLIDTAQLRLASDNTQWLSETIQHWRVSAVIPDLVRYANDKWSQSQIDTVIELCRTATNAIRDCGDIPAHKIESWSIFGDQRVFARGHDPVPCEPVARLGDAFVALLQGRLAEAPENHWWFFTLEEHVETIIKRVSP